MRTNEPPLPGRRNLLRAGVGAVATMALTGGARADPGAVAVEMRHAENIYSRMLNVRPVIGAFETLTAFGNSRLSPEVLRAMQEASQHFVSMRELNDAAGRRIAKILGAEAALVTAGSACAMMLAAAACMTGTDPEKVDALPHPTWPKRECLMQQAHRFPYDRMYRAAGATIVTVETREQMINAISERTALIAAMSMVERDLKPGVLSIEELIQIGRRSGVPVQVDDAGEAPPVGKLTKYIALGADLVNISGGKAMQGPAATGILAGRKDLIDAAAMNASPNEGVGRAAKVGKEEIMGLLVALDQYVNRDERAALAGYSRMARYIVEQLQDVPGLKATLRRSSKGFDDVEFSWDRQIIPLDEVEVQKRLREGEPRIVYMSEIPYAYTGPTLVTALLHPAEVVLVAKRMRRFFLEAARG